MSQSDCNKFTASIRGLRKATEIYDEKAERQDLPMLLILAKRMRSEIAEIKYQLGLDPYETVFRNDLAKKKGYDYIETFHDDVAWAWSEKDGKTATFVIDRDGRKLSPDLAGSRHTGFHSGWAWVYWRRNDGIVELSLVNKTSKASRKLPAAQMINVSGYEETGVIIVERKVDDDQLSYYIDNEGEVAFHKNFVPVSAFSEGVAWAYRNDGHKEHVCIIDELGKGKAIFGFTYCEDDGYQEFSDGMAWHRSDHIWYLYNTDGELLYESPKNKYYSVNPFHDGRAVVEVKGEGFYFLDPKGTIIAGPFDDVEEMNGGAAAIMEDNKCNLIDTDGKYLLPDEEYYDLQGFDRGVFFAKKMSDAGMILIDKHGRQLGGEKFDQVLENNDQGVALVKSYKGEPFTINTLGQPVFTRFVETSNKEAL